MQNSNLKNKYVVKMIFIYIWLIILKNTDSVYSIYLFCAGSGLISVYFNELHKINKFENKNHNILAIFFSILIGIEISAANWRIFYNGIKHIPGMVKGIGFILENIVMIAITACIFFNIILSLNYIVDYFQARKEKIISKKERAFCFLIIVISDLIWMILYNYPTMLTVDSMNQLQQIMTGSYSNHHPYYYTRFIKICLDLGKIIFNNINCGFVIYSIVQIILMSGTFTYLLTTVFKITENKKVVILGLIYYIVMPFHISFASTMWKDTLFSASVTAFCVAIYRIIRKIGNTKVDYFILIVSAIVSCMFRSNGLFAFIISTVIFCGLYRKKMLKITIIMISVIIVSFLLKHVTLKQLNVTQARTAESLSIPEQQIARVISDGCKLNKYEYNMINKLINVEIVKKEYKNYISDPIKNRIDDSYLKKHKKEYLMLWYTIGRKYPDEYIKAWIDQTRGYWNGGYDYWVCPDEPFYENNFGYQKKVIIKQGFRYFQLFRSEILKPVTSIGLYMWILEIALLFSMIRKNKIGIFICVPTLAVIISLLISTPVYCEFRYIYCLFTSFPLIVCNFIIKDNKLNEQN